MDAEETAGVIRAPPVPAVAIRRVVAAVFRNLHIFTEGCARTVEEHLRTSGKSLYDGRTSFFDLLMLVFPRDKPLASSRAGFQSNMRAVFGALLMSWAATCERWCAEYEELRTIQQSPDRVSAYAVARSSAFRSEAKSASAGNYSLGAKGKAGADLRAVLVEAHNADIPSGDLLVKLTLQILNMRPLVWHRELTPTATLLDPVPWEPSAVDIIDTIKYEDYFSFLYRDIVAEFKDKDNGQLAPMPSLSALSAVVYVDGTGMTARSVFTTAIEQLAAESRAMYPSDKPRNRRGVCPTGTDYVVMYNGGVVNARVTDMGLDAAIRAAIRKYGPIEGVSIVCNATKVQFDAVALDETALWP